MNTAAKIAQSLLAAEAVKLQPDDPFTWASGLRAPIYCDNRVLLSYPGARNAIVDALRDIADRFDGVAGIAGVATAGIPHGALLADRLRLPFIYIRGKAKEHGRQNQIEGRLEPGARYLVIEDLISTGGSSLRAIEALRAAGGEVAGVAAIFTYELPVATVAFAEAGVQLTTLTDYTTLVREAATKGYVSGQATATLANWREDPKAWSAAFERKG